MDVVVELLTGTTVASAGTTTSLTGAALASAGTMIAATGTTNSRKISTVNQPLNPKTYLVLQMLP